MFKRIGDRWAVFGVALLVLVWVATQGEQPTSAQQFGAAPAKAAVSVKCFELRNVKWWVKYEEHFRISYEITNNCEVPAGIELRAVIRDGKGDLIKTPEWWPASINNIEPGQVYADVMALGVDRLPASVNVTLNSAKQWRK
jgi:hypothetical protein